MISGKRILAIVPARGGSKGVPLKNIHPLNGIPLIQWTSNVIKELKYIDRALVSTDHSEIARVSLECGLTVPFIRPENISGDFISDHAVLKHALVETENLDNLKYDIVIMLQPTSPFRKPEHITRTIEKLISGNFDSVWTVSECNTKYHPLKLLKLEEDGFEYFDPKGAAIIARQQLKNYYIRNGVCYAFTRNCILEMQNIKGARSGAVVINEELVNIDTKMDFLWAEFFINCQPK